MAKFYLLGLLAALVSTPSVAGPQTDCTSTQAQFEAVKKDMSYEDVAAIVGCEGVLTMWGPESATPWLARYTWSGNGGEKSSFTAEFYQGQLIRKAKSRLK